MTIEGMLQVLVRFGIRSDLMDADEKDFYIHYLNLAHLELYRHVSPYLASLTRQTDGRTVGGTLELLEKPFMVLGVQNIDTLKKLTPSRPSTSP
jgi:hypothetical protein